MKKANVKICFGNVIGEMLNDSGNALRDQEMGEKPDFQDLFFTCIYK